MEKIRIPVNESEYKVYYDYCLKYYQVHDSARKQSIHAFVDLYVKGIIPVEKQDLRQARNLLAERCNELKREQNAAGREGDNTMLFQFRVCSDISLFLEDLEKMYRLIVKQGIVADYLLILGTFSKIINEDENSHLLVKYDLKDEVIESLARPLAEIIRQRLGNMPLWNSILRELIDIATQFNRQYSEPKFDLDILKVIAPDVVAFFHKDVPSRKILAVLPSYFEEHELAEFETILRRAPEQNTDQAANVNLETIYEPLKVVASAVVLQRYQWSQGILKISDQYSLTPTSGMLPYYEGPYPVVSPPPRFLNPMQVNGHKTFDIVVRPNATDEETSPFQENPPSGVASGKSELKPLIPIIIGIVVIVMILSAAIFFSSYLIHPRAVNTTISTQNSTTTTTIVPIKSPTTVPLPTRQSYSSHEITSHLLEIGFGPNNNVINKPTQERLIVSLEGLYEGSDINVLDTFIGQFNNYSSTTKISENINYARQGDIALSFAPSNTFSQVNTTVQYQDFKNGTWYFVVTPEKTIINSDLKGDDRTRWVLRAVLYNLGFYGETADYGDSLFYAGKNNVSQLSDIDLKALQLMYGKKITNGMNKDNIRTYII